MDTGVSRDEAVGAAKGSLNFFAALSLPDVFKFPFPPVFLAVWQMLVDAVAEERGKKRIAVGLPRGFGKTILLKLFVVYCILFTNRKFILVVCNTATLAENFIADVSDTMSSLNIIRVFGDWRLSSEQDTQSQKKFSFRGRPIIIAALGAGSSLRGLNIKYARPDLIIMDDMQSKEQARSATDATNLLSWMVGTLMKASDNARCLYVFLGNMYPYEGSILKKLKINPQWTSFICGAILADGDSIWPELKSVEDILDELEHDESMGHPEEFYAEVMNDDVAGSKSRVNFAEINVWLDDTPGMEPQAGFIIIDPSAAKKKTSDDVAIGAVHIYDGEPILWEVLADKFDPYQQCVKSIQMALKYKFRTIIVEDVAYQATLIFWMDRVMQQLGISGMQILPISPRGQQKNYRIGEMLKQLQAKKERVWIHPQIRSLVLHQIVYFDPFKTNNKDDVLDIMAYMYQVIQQYRYMLVLLFDIDSGSIQMDDSTTLEIEF